MSYEIRNTFDYYNGISVRKVNPAVETLIGKQCIAYLNPNMSVRRIVTNVNISQIIPKIVRYTKEGDINVVVFPRFIFDQTLSTLQLKVGARA